MSSSGGEAARPVCGRRVDVERRKICWRPLTALAVSVTLCIAPRALGAPSPRVVALRHFASRAHTRIVVELSAPAAPALTALPAPEDGPPRRIYLDLAGVNVGAGVTKSLDVPEGPVAAVRVGMRDVETTRLVIVLREVEAYEVSRLRGPPRVVLDLRAPAQLPLQKVERRRSTKEGQPGQVGEVTSKAPQKQPGKSTASVHRAPAGETQDRKSRKGRAETREPPKQPGRQATKAPPRKSSAGVPPLKVVIDPGHGGKDPGARGVGGLEEKTVVLAIARKLAARLREALGASVVLTRTRDVYVSLEARTALANAERADLFVSIHTNASTSRKLSGVETYYLENTDDRATLRLAAMENGLTLIGDAPRAGGGDLSYILSDLVQQGKLEDSIALSKALHQGLVRRVGKTHRDVVDLGVKRGPFYVLVGAYMPCALVEVSFLTNRVEEKRLGTESYRSAIVEGLLNGVRQYAQALRSVGTL